MKIRLVFIGLFSFLSCTTPKTQKDLIVGHWTYVGTTDIHSEEEKSSDFKISTGGLWDDYPDLTLFKNGTLKERHKNGVVENGIWEIENDSLKLSREVEFENEEKAMSNSVIKANIRFELNGQKYMYAGDYAIKLLEMETMELGNQTLFNLYKRTK